MAQDEPQGAERFVPRSSDIRRLRAAARSCRGCDLWRDATQAVFGDGPSNARMMAVGEQPGDQEDRQGRPFVGPAGRILHEAFAGAGIDPAEVYVTNVVKHFRWQPKGKRRIHKTPSRRQVLACEPWFAAELATVQPQVLVVLGATAATALFGSGFRVTQRRGTVIPGPDAVPTVVTLHPSAALRRPASCATRRWPGWPPTLRVAADGLCAA